MSYKHMHVQPRHVHVNVRMCLRAVFALHLSQFYTTPAVITRMGLRGTLYYIVPPQKKTILIVMAFTLVVFSPEVVNPVGGLCLHPGIRAHPTDANLTEVLYGL